MNRKFRMFSLLLATAIVLGACAAPATPATSGPAPEPEIVEVTRIVEVEGTPVVEIVTATPAPDPSNEVTLPIDRVRISVASQLTNLDTVQNCPQPCQITVGRTAGHIVTVDEQWQIHPELAESVEISDDATVYTITLREGLIYSDGSPVLAEDIVYTYERNRDLEGFYFGGLLAGVESAEAVDERTAVFTLAAPSLDFAITLGHQVMVVHPKALIESDPDYFLHPVSAGAYMIKDYTPGATSWVVEENPNYWRGPMAVKEIEFIHIADQTSRVLQLATGAIDFGHDLSIVARDSLPPEVNSFAVPIHGVYNLAFNQTLPADHPLNDARVRQAIYFALDPQEITDKAFGGISGVQTSFLYPGPAEGLEGLFTGQDLDKAKALMAETPWPDGFEVVMNTWGQRAGWIDASLVIIEQLAEIGIIVTLEPVEDAVAIANLRSNNYVMEFGGMAGYPMEQLRGMIVPGNFWSNALGYNNPVAVDLVTRAATATNVEERIELIHEAQRVAFEDMPVAPISERVQLMGSRIDLSVLHLCNEPPGVNPCVEPMEALGQ